ncbi:SCO2400 family protein, partial [Streptomyces sp. HGB0020]
MDYCHPCRRHLNGALACPGCGAQVEQLRAHAERDGAPAYAGERAGGAYEGHEGGYGGAQSPYEADAEDEDEGAEDDESADERPAGRAAARRAQGRGRG